MHLTREPINASAFAAAPVPSHCGGVDVFLGVVRDHHEGKGVRELYYDCYEPMAEKQIARIIRDTLKETGAQEIKVRHRIGRLQIGEVAVAIQACGVHRDEAFAACRRVIDAIKHEVPIWKKEIYTDNTSSWVLCTHKT